MVRSIPIIRLYDVLLVAIQIELSDQLVRELRANLGREIQAGNVRGVVIEVSGVDTFDTYIARSLRDMAQIAKLMGVRTIITGLAPGIAITLVEMGMQLEGVTTTLNLESALELLTPRGRSDPTDDDDLLIEDVEARYDPDHLFDVTDWSAG